MNLSKAEEFLAAAEACLQLGYPNACASRSYYAMFHAATHALAQFGVEREEWGHHTLQSAFARELIQRRKVLPAALAKYLQDAYKVRTTADYRMQEVSHRIARRTLAWARELQNLVKEAKYT